MFTVRTYFTLPSHIELTEEVRRVLARKNLTAEGFTERVFDTQDALFNYVRGFDYTDQHHKVCNRFLDAIMCCVNDARSQAQSFNLREVYDDYLVFGSACYCVGYLTHDANGRVVDLRNYSKELFAFDTEAYNAARRLERRDAWDAKYAIRNARRDKLRKLTEGKFYWRYYRAIQTTQERRFAADSEHKPYIRGRRSLANLPNSYDDHYFHCEKNWKARDKKAQRQWEVNVKKHIDTIKVSSPFEDGEDTFISAVCRLRNVLIK